LGHSRPVTGEKIEKKNSRNYQDKISRILAPSQKGQFKNNRKQATNVLQSKSRNDIELKTNRKWAYDDSNKFTRLSHPHIQGLF